jgi:phosphatidylglycerophosphatase A
MKNNIVKFIATGCFSGYLRPYPGTWGTIPAWLIAFFLIKGNLLILLAVCVITLLISVWSSGAAETVYGHDSRKIVIDEWAGMFITVLFVEYSLTNYIVAFVAFRAFDVIKLPPAIQFEKLPRGWGVTMDDVAAGIYANFFTHAVVWAIANYGDLWGS